MEIKPSLIVIDSLRAYRPGATEKNPEAAKFLGELRKLARKFGCSFLIVHHIRKPSAERVLRVDEETSVASALQEMEGPRALVNQTDVRIAIAEGDGNRSALKLKWSRRVHGDSPLVLLERIFDAGEPAGYLQLTGTDFLNRQQAGAFARLPCDSEFGFKNAKQALGEADNRTNEFLQKCQHHGLIEKLGKNRYKKVSTPGVGGVAC
ncbi:MAG TPA: AAA family ATPase [Candidatus Acidoferrales bacterium]|nr:AAA family ATPase [Candidatus Acidoferrales bacterium]